MKKLDTNVGPTLLFHDPKEEGQHVFLQKEAVAKDVSKEIVT